MHKCHIQSNPLTINSPKVHFPPCFSQVSVLSPALTVTRSFVHQATGKHTLLLTSKAYNRRNTSSPEKPTKQKCPRITYLCLISPCRSPSSSQTSVRACFDRYMSPHTVVVHLSLTWKGKHCCHYVCCVSFCTKWNVFFHMEVHVLLVHMSLNRPHPIPEPSFGSATVPGGGGQWSTIQVPVLQ